MTFHPKVHRILFAATAALAVWAISASANATPAAASPVGQITPMPIPFLPGQAIPPPAPDLTIESLDLDRTHYLVDMAWQATVRVRNIGAAASGSFWLKGNLCRFLEGASALACGIDLDFGGGGSIDPDGFLDLAVPPTSFNSVPTDGSPDYTSDIIGVPDGGTVYLRVTALLGSATQPGPTEANDGNNLALASAVFPSGPANPAYDPALDPDGDGWYAPGDCNPGNSNVFPWAYERALTGIDEDCSGGDADEVPECPGIFYHEGETTDPCGAPPGIWGSAGDRLDLDGDGYGEDEECDDTNSGVHPGAEELDDGQDNNCNGLTDETFAVPDWAFADFQLFRGFTRASSPSDPVQSPYFYPVLRYSFAIENAGESLGAGEEGLVDDLILIRDLEGNVFATGRQWVIPYTAFNYGGGFVPACDPIGMIAVIPSGGIFGEVETSNNVATANTPPQNPMANLIAEGPFDRDLRFVSAPGLSIDSQTHHSEAVGTCPPLLMEIPGTGLPDTYVIGYTIYVNGQLVYDGLWDNNYWSHFSLDDLASPGDRICYQVVLDPHNWVFEVDEGNNSYTQLFEFRNQLFAPPRLELLDAYSDGPASCAGGEIGPPGSSTASALSPGAFGPVLGGLGGAILLGSLGAVIGLYGPRRFGFTKPGLMPIASGVVLGIAIGGAGGAALVGRLLPPPLAEIAPSADSRGGSPGAASCDSMVDWAVSAPADGQAFRSGDPLTFNLRLAGETGIGQVDRFTLRLRNPAERELTIPADVREGASVLDLVEAVLHQAGPGYFIEGEYQWDILLGQIATSDEADPFASVCRLSPTRTFSIEGVEPVGGEAPTATATATSTSTPTAQGPILPPPTRTSTPSATAPPDTSGPSFKSFSDSPDPIYVTQPAGCTPTTSTISASITDPSGVASAAILFFHTTIGQVPMTNAGGNTWTAALGPYSGTGDGTVDYQIRATDGEGNVSDSSFGQVAVLACIP